MCGKVVIDLDLDFLSATMVGWCKLPFKQVCVKIDQLPAVRNGKFCWGGCILLLCAVAVHVSLSSVKGEYLSELCGLHIKHILGCL